MSKRRNVKPAKTLMKDSISHTRDNLVIEGELVQWRLWFWLVRRSVAVPSGLKR